MTAPKKRTTTTTHGLTAAAADSAPTRIGTSNCIQEHRVPHDSLTENLGVFMFWIPKQRVSSIITCGFTRI